VKEVLGQAVLLSGEPGIGKSRLVRTLKEHIAGEPHTRWECRCSAYHQDSALYPVLDLFERALQFGRDDLPTQKLAKIEAALARYGLAQPEAVALWAALLSVPVPEDRPPLNLTPQRQKQKTFEAVLGLLFALAAQQPVVFIIEDLHWVDPSTRELLDLVLEQVPTRSILMVLTCRPEFRPPWGNRAHLTHLTLNRFTRRQTGLMVERVTGGKVLPQEGTAEVKPELLAHHYTEGGLVDEAIGFWLLAGKRAFKQGANTETIAHLTKGLEVLRSLPDGRERLDRECDLQAALGMTLMSTKGYAAPEVEQTYLRALDLSRQTGNTVQRFRAGWGLFWVSMLRAEVPKCWEVGEELVRLAAPVGDPALLVPAHDARGQNAYYFGDLPAARRHLERAILIWDSGRHDVEGVHAPVQHAPWSSSLTSGNTIGSRSHLALALWCLGYPAQALERSRDTLALARTAAQPQSRAYALGFASMFHHLRHEGAVAHAQAETMIELAREQRLPLWLAMARCRLGAALIDLGRPEEGIESMREGLEAWRATGAELETPYRLSVLAEAYGRLGQIEAGLGAVAQALAAVNKSGEGVWKAELKRLRGDLLLTQSDENGPEAEACFRQAIAVASRQQAKSLELRATLSFSRLLQRQGKREDARRILADIYEWFTEGFDTPDLKDARALLDELTTR
jgi:predicted ATPase